MLVPMIKLRMGMDLDGVIYRFQDTFRFLAEYYLNKKLPPTSEMFDAWDGHLRYLSAEEDKWLFTEGIEKGLFRHGSLYRGAAEAIRELDRLVYLVAITSRPKAASRDTFDWITFHRFPFDEVHILEGQPKSSVAVCGIYLDDATHNVEELAITHPQSLVLLMDRPWNQKWNEKLYPNVRRMKTWYQVIQEVRSFTNLAKERVMEMLAEKTTEESSAST